jgi:type I restriction enzyme M protein
MFTGDAGSGESEIRRWLLESDYVEGILALPNDMFFNTGIGTYIWILTNKKSAERKGTVQLVNLTDEWTQMRKSEGSKRKFISQDQITQIVNEYDEYVDSKRTKIFKNTDFAYRKVAIKRPLRAVIEIKDERISVLHEVKGFAKLTDAQKLSWISFITDNIGQHEYEFFINAAKAHNNQGDFGKVGAPLGKLLTTHFMVNDEDAPIVTDAKGNAIADTSLNDNETVPYGDSVEAYLEREVIPHVPDAFIDYSVRDEKDGEVGIVGYEINFNRYFYKYDPPRSLKNIDIDLKASEARIQALLDEVAE